MSDDPWSGVARPFSSDWDTLEGKLEDALYQEWRRQHPLPLKAYGRTITVDANFNVVATSGYEETPVPEEITEERLAQIEHQAKEYRIVGVSVADVLALVAEVRRLREKVAELEEKLNG